MLLEKEIGLMVFNLGKQLNLEKAHLEKNRDGLTGSPLPVSHYFLIKHSEEENKYFPQ